MNDQNEAREALTGFDLHMQAGVPSHVILGGYESEQIVRALTERGYIPPLPAPSDDEREATRGADESEYVPTTQEIRDYVEVGGEPRPWDDPDDPKDALRAAAFDRWLAAHDAELLAPRPQIPAPDADEAFEAWLAAGNGNPDVGGGSDGDREAFLAGFRLASHPAPPDGSTDERTQP